MIRIKLIWSQYWKNLYWNLYKVSNWKFLIILLSVVQHSISYYSGLSRLGEPRLNFESFIRTFQRNWKREVDTYCNLLNKSKFTTRQSKIKLSYTLNTFQSFQSCNNSNSIGGIYFGVNRMTPSMCLFVLSSRPISDRWTLVLWITFVLFPCC